MMEDGEPLHGDTSDLNTTFPWLSEKETKHPESIGPYRILGVLGVGGMGVVYAGQQTTPVRRRVALKVIKLGMDTREVVARFEAERQALALMNHPNIARVHDAGATEDGRPYFVMEHVQGIPLTEYFDRHRLDLRQRLQLFLQVCHGVQHAHHRGIIHRDIKPSNILVACPDETAVAKIIDFGVAKATNQRLTEKTVYTELGRAVGTPAYMSPEQAEMSAEEVDVRTDMYSLGVILYELLVSQLPIGDEVLARAAYDEILRRIREEEPPPPSTCWHRLNPETTSKLAASRQTSSGSFASQLRGDLDWITMKCIEKERSRRYPTASELAADVERFLDGEPVLARPPSAVYRLRKFARKNVAPVVAATSVLVALTIGLVVSLAFYFKAEESAIEARTNAEEIEKKALEIEEKLAQVLRLSHVKQLEDYRQEADRLWPASSAMVQPMEAWLEKSRSLAAQLGRHRETLKTLREAALPYDEEKQRLDLEKQEDRGRLETLQLREAELSKAIDSPERAETPAADLPPELARVRAELEALETSLSRRRTWEFEETEDRWWHDTLQGLVEGLEAFPETIASVERRLAFARSVRRRTLIDVQEHWSRAVRSIADPKECPLYRGLRIVPQEGLVPLGLNPQSALWEFAYLQSGDTLSLSDAGEPRLSEASALVFVLIPGGHVFMGSVPDKKTALDENTPVDPAAQPDERPVRRVELAPFFLSKYEMTQAQWIRASEGGNPSAYPDGHEIGKHRVNALHPVERVSWLQCEQILFRLGLEFPTEAQWEYAARAGTSTPWWTGSDRESLAGAANLADQAAAEAGASWPDILDWPEFDDGHAVHAPIGSLRANDFGLHDVAGNVWEHCKDWYGSYDLSAKPGDGERQVAAGRGRLRVSRGGSFGRSALKARSALREKFAPSTRGSNVGLRPARRLLGG